MRVQVQILATAFFFNFPLFHDQLNWPKVRPVFPIEPRFIRFSQNSCIPGPLCLKTEFQFDSRFSRSSPSFKTLLFSSPTSSLPFLFFSFLFFSLLFSHPHTSSHTPRFPLFSVLNFLSSLSFYVVFLFVLLFSFVCVFFNLIAVNYQCFILSDFSPLLTQVSHHGFFFFFFFFFFVRYICLFHFFLLLFFFFFWLRFQFYSPNSMPIES